MSAPITWGIMHTSRRSKLKSDMGGREALLHYLLHFDLSKVNLREVPKTAALLDQKLASLTPVHAWWFDVLQSGQLPGASKGLGGAHRCGRTQLFADYIAHAEQQGVRRRAIETVLGRRLRKLAPGLRSQQMTAELQRQRVYRSRRWRSAGASLSICCSST